MAVFYYDNGHIIADFDATEKNLSAYRRKYQFAELTRGELISVLENPTPKKVHHLTDDEIKAQNEWALSMMTDEEKSWIIPTRSIEQEQFEFYLNAEGITGEERRKKYKDFRNSNFKRRRPYGREVQYG